MGDHSSPSNSECSNVRFRIEPENLNLFSPISNFKASLSPKDNQDSLVILKSDFESSHNFLNLTLGRESLSKSLIFGDISDVGRESLGILQLDKVDVTFGDEKLSEFSITNVNSTRVFDVGFLLSPKKSCNSEGLSFNSESLDLPSKIYNAAKSDNSSVFSPIQSFLNNGQMVSLSHIEPRTRCASQPTENVLKSEHQIFWSVNQPKTTFLPTDEIQSKKLDFDDTDDLFHDSVFIEGKHLAQKIADGSFLEDENGSLDCTPQPDWPSDIDDLETSTKESPKVNKETVFKTINKFFPNDEQKKEEEQIISDQKDTDLTKKKTGRTKSDSASVMSRNPREILQNLTEIFNCTHRSENQKFQGRMLMNSLINLLDTSQNIQDCNDSGHSSIPEIEISPEDETDFKNPLKKLNSESEPKRRLSLSSSVDKNKPRPRNSSLAGGTTITVTKKNDVKLKSKPGNTRTKEGPIKAVIPVEKMKKTRESIAEKTNNATLPIKRTSTPVNEPKLKPNATSTPDTGFSRTVPKKVILAKVNSFNKIKVSSKDGARKSEINNSIGSRKSFSKESHPVNKIQIQDRKPHRSYSISEGMLDCVPRPKRSNSLGEERGIMSSLKRVRESMLKSAYYNKKSGILVDQNNSKNEIKPEKRVSFSDKDEAVKLRKNKENVRPKM